MSFSLKKLTFKILHAEGTPHSIGMGIGLGLFMSFLLPVGTQTFPALGIAFLIKANKALTFLFTWVSNPLTVIFIYPFQCYIGGWLVAHPLNIEELNGKFETIVQADGFTNACHAFLNLGGEIMRAFFAGGFALGIVSGVIGYFIGYKLVDSYRKRKEAKKLARAEHLDNTSQN